MQKVKSQIIHRCGSCLSCGDCCILLGNKGRFARCVFYNLDSSQHCTIYNHRPDVCRDFPRAPFDVQYKPNCGFYFLDSKGNKIDGYMDKRTRLRFVSRHSHMSDKGKKEIANKTK